MFVCIVLVAVLTAHSLQVSGMVPAPKGGDLTYKFQEHKNLERYRRETATTEPERSQFIDTLFNMSGPKWTPPFRRKSSHLITEKPLPNVFSFRKFSQGWDSVSKSIGQNIIENAVAKQIERHPYLKIPIKTLTAVNNLIQSSRPAIKKFRDFAARRFEKTTTKAPETESAIQKRSPVYIRPVGEIN